MPLRPTLLQPRLCSYLPSLATVSGVMGIVLATMLAPLPLAAQQPAAAGDAPAVAGEFRPGWSILPDATQGMVAVDNLPQLLERWTRTSLAELQHDEAMRPFLESQREAIEEKLADAGLRAGLRFEDLRDAVSGELVLAWIRFDDDRRRPYSVAMLADTRQRDAQRDAMLEKIDAELRRRDATASTVELHGEPVTLYTLPQKRGQLTVERLLVVTVDGRVIISDRPETMETLIVASREGTTGGLAEAADYRDVFSQLQNPEADPSAEPEPVLRWFARPIGMAMIARDAAGVDRGRQIDVLKLLRNQGFDAIKSAGGQIHVATEDYDLLHRSFILAPPTSSGPERYTEAARMLQFPNAPMADPPGWTLPTAATFFQAHWKMEDAFWAAETLVDEAFGEKIFRKVIQDIRDDEEGPQIDLANDVIANFDDNLLVLTDNRIEDGQTSERALGAIRLRDSAVVAKAINGAMEGDPDVYQVPYDEHLIWEIRPGEADPPGFEVDGFPDFGFDEPEPTEANEPEPLLEKWALTVYGDYLFFASHAELLVEIIEHEQQGGPTIAAAPEFQRVRDVIATLGGESRAMERIVRTDLAWRVKYELLRQEKFLESDSMLATLLRRARDRAETAEPGEPLKIQTGQLPPFAQIRHHLQPGGGFTRTEENGWSATHFLLRKP